MRIMGFSQMWPKLQQDKFTTFRFSRRDKDWAIEEVVKVVYKPRRKGGGGFLGIAEIVRSVPRDVYGKLSAWSTISEKEAVVDGFKSRAHMELWLIDTYGVERIANEPMNKLTLKWQGKRE